MAQFGSRSQHSFISENIKISYNLILYTQYWYTEVILADMHTYHTHAIITRSLYIFYPIFHCGLSCRAGSVTDDLCSKHENSSILGSKIRGL